MTQDRGFVLLNALVLVAAFAAAAVFVLSRAEQARQRQASLQRAGQAILYLDAFESLALTLLRSDQRAGAVDGLGDNWAQADYDVTVDRGRVAGEIHDLQGRFNVNWLSNSEDLLARQAFVRLVVGLGLREQLARDITAFVSPGGPTSQQTYKRLQPAIAPVGGPVLLLEQLQVVAGMRPREFERLKPYLAALTSDSTLNVNTASVKVLHSLLPGANEAGLEQVLQNRRRVPFQSIDDFEIRMSLALGVEGLSDLQKLHFDIGSAWFQADIAVELDSRILTRQTIFERRPLPYGPQVAYRLEGRI